MKRSWKIALLGVAAAAVAVTAAYAAGGESDPLVTLSYLKNIFTGQVQTMVDETVANSDAQLKNDLDKAISDWDARVKSAIDSAETGVGQGSALFKSVSFGKGQSLKCAAGAELVLRSGSAVANADLLDQTDGTALTKGQALKANHLYLVLTACSVTVPEAALTGTVNNGPLNVRAGAGTSRAVARSVSTVRAASRSWSTAVGSTSSRSSTCRKRARSASISSTTRARRSLRACAASSPASAEAKKCR